MSNRLSESDFAIRIHDTNGDAIEQAVRARFPGVHLTRTPIAVDAKLKVLVAFRPPADEDLDGYDWIHSTGAGVDALLDGLGPREAYPLMTRTIGRMAEQIGEYCLAYALEHLQRLAVRRRLQVERKWDRAAALPDYLFRADVAVIGTGEIGQGIARAFAALGSTVTGYSRRGQAASGFDTVRKLDEFGKHPFVVAALPLTDATDGLIGERIFSALDGAAFINVGRGATVDDDALRAALDAGQVGHAVLDVFREEPLPEASWMWSHPDVTITPHVSGGTLPSDAADRLVELIGRRLAGEAIASQVDPAAGY